MGKGKPPLAWWEAPGAVRKAGRKFLPLFPI